MPVSIGIEHGERRLEARRYQEVLQVFVAAVDEKFYHFLVALDSLDAAGGSGGKRRVTSMAYEPPLTLRTAGAAADLTPSPRRARRVEGRTPRADISGFSSVPDSSSSIIVKTSRAAERNSRLKSSSAFSAARWRRSRSSASCARRFFRPRWMADSLCAYDVMSTRSGNDASIASIGPPARPDCQGLSPPAGELPVQSSRHATAGALARRPKTRSASQRSLLNSCLTNSPCAKRQHSDTPRDTCCSNRSIHAHTHQQQT